MNAVRLTVSLLCAVMMALALTLLGVAISISRTALDSDFVIGQLTDVPVEDFFAAEARKQVPAGGEFLFPLIDQAAKDLEPWARDQTAAVVRAAEEYLHGDDAFSATISFVEAKDYLETHLLDALVQAGLPVDRVPEGQLRSLIAQIMAQVDAIIPDRFEITEAFLDTDTLSSLRTARTWAGYVDASLWLLPLLALLLLLAIAWTQEWRVRGVARFVGLATVLAAIGTVVARSVALARLPSLVPSSVPPQLSVIVPDVIEQCTGPMLPYALMVALLGIGLLLLSFLLKPVTRP